MTLLAFVIILSRVALFYNISSMATNEVIKYDNTKQTMRLIKCLLRRRYSPMLLVGR